MRLPRWLGYDKFDRIVNGALLLGVLGVLALGLTAAAQRSAPTQVAGPDSAIVKRWLPKPVQVSGWDTVMASPPRPVETSDLTTRDTELELSSANAAAANNQTCAAAVGKRTYLTGFTVTGAGATAASVITVTVTGLTNTLNYKIAVPAGANVGITPLLVLFHRPVPASADNTAIVVNVPSFGAGNTAAAATAHCFQRTS